MSDKYFLVTTANELSWPEGRHILFLGEWCKKYCRRDFWNGLDSTTLKYHWDDQDKYYTDYLYLDTLYEKKLSQLSIVLGELHGLDSAVRYWRIIIGPWLRFFLDALFDRFESIRCAYDSCRVGDTFVLSYDLVEWVPSDFQQFYDQFVDDNWNHIIYTECIRAIGASYIQRDEIVLAPPKRSTSSLSRFKLYTKRFLDLYGSYLPQPFNRVAIVSGYMPKKRLWALQKSFGQLPYFTSPAIKVNSTHVDLDLRASLESGESVSVFESLASDLIMKLMPTNYLEDFSEFRKCSLNRFPQNPSVMFTANAYQANDGFKMWAADNISKGVPLIIGQHGGNMGIALFNQTEDHQIKISDYFASWGWLSKKHSNVVPMPSLKLPNKSIESDNSGDILVTVAAYPRYFYCHYSVPVAGHFIEYINQQILFAESIDLNLKKSLKIRVGFDSFGWDVEERLIDAGLGEAIDAYKGSFLDRLQGCRISISTYNATVFLETLAINFPTLIYFKLDRFAIRQEARPMIDMLRQVGIFHDSPESAATFLNDIGDDINAWWSGSELQKVRKEFCRQYAWDDCDWLSYWKDLFKASSPK